MNDDLRTPLSEEAAEIAADEADRAEMAEVTALMKDIATCEAAGTSTDRER